MAKQVDIQAMIDTIVQTVHPSRVILFGSHALGKTTEDSDIDLCIIEKQSFDSTHSRRKEIAKLYRALSIYAIPKDLLLFSENELGEEANQHLIQPIQAYGKVLYDAG